MKNGRQIQGMISSSATRNAQLQKRIASFLNMDYSITNKSVQINYISNNIVNIIINNDFSNTVDFDTNQLPN